MAVELRTEVGSEDFVVSHHTLLEQRWCPGSGVCSNLLDSPNHNRLEDL